MQDKKQPREVTVDDSNKIVEVLNQLLRTRLASLEAKVARLESKLRLGS